VIACLAVDVRELIDHVPPLGQELGLGCRAPAADMGPLLNLALSSHGRCNRPTAARLPQPTPLALGADEAMSNNPALSHKIPFTPLPPFPLIACRILSRCMRGATHLALGGLWGVWQNLGKASRGNWCHCGPFLLYLPSNGATKCTISEWKRFHRGKWRRHGQGTSHDEMLAMRGMQRFHLMVWV
jgi:hypothetical protein